MGNQIKKILCNNLLVIYHEDFYCCIVYPPRWSSIIRPSYYCHPRTSIICCYSCRGYVRKSIGNQKIQDKWNEIRFLDREEAQKSLDGEWLEAFNKFHGQYDSDMERMEEIVNKLEKQINPPKVEKKTKGQRRRDAYAAKLERAGHAYNQ